MAKWIKYILFLVIGLLLLFFAFKNTNLNDLIEEAKKVDLLWIWLSMFFGFLAFISRGLRWVYLIENMGYNAKKINSIYAVCIGYFTNLAFPRAGELSRCTSLSESDKIPVNKLFGTIILERTIDFIILLSLISFVFLMKLETVYAFFNRIEKEIGGNSNIGFILIAVFSIILIVFIVFKTKFKKTSTYQKIVDFLKGLSDGFKSIKGIKNKWAFWGHTIFIWFMYFIMTYVCFFAIESTKLLTLIDGLFIMVVGGLGMVLPVQGGVGAYHLLVSEALMSINLENSINNTDATLFASVVHACQTLMTLFVGSISLLMLFLSKRKAKSESA